MAKDFIIKKSAISGKGVFANKNFKKGEVVIKWSLDKILNKQEVDLLPIKEKQYIVKQGKKYILMQPPARYVNHSCNSNTVPKNNCDVAIRDIKEGEEITSNYFEENGIDEFVCNCKSKNCKKIIK